MAGLVPCSQHKASIENRGDHRKKQSPQPLESEAFYLKIDYWIHILSCFLKRDLFCNSRARLILLALPHQLLEWALRNLPL